MANLVSSRFLIALSALTLSVFLTVSTINASPFGEFNFHRKGLFRDIDVSTKNALREKILNSIQNGTPCPSKPENAPLPENAAGCERKTVPIEEFTTPANQGAGNLLFFNAKKQNFK